MPVKHDSAWPIRWASLISRRRTRTETTLPPARLQAVCASQASRYLPTRMYRTAVEFAVDSDFAVASVPDLRKRVPVDLSTSLSLGLMPQPGQARVFPVHGFLRY